MIDFTFTTWLQGQRWRDDPVSDLARDVDADDDWPQDRDQYLLLLLHDHLTERGAGDAAHDTLDQAWAEWHARPRIHQPPRTDDAGDTPARRR